MGCSNYPAPQSLQDLFLCLPALQTAQAQSWFGTASDPLVPSGQTASETGTEPEVPAEPATIQHVVRQAAAACSAESYCQYPALRRHPVRLPAEPGRQGRLGSRRSLSEPAQAPVLQPLAAPRFGRTGQP